MTPIRIITAAAMTAGSALALPVLAIEPAPGAQVGVTITEIAAAIAPEGYAVRKFEHDDGKIEVTAVREDQRVEFTIDSDSGAVTRLSSRTRLGEGKALGATDDAIRAALIADGYDIRKYERERRKIEVKATRDGKRYEIDIDPATGRIIEVEERNK